ncbi:mitochondrial metalloendopeptidase OMA1-like [Aegilops tauschii subsp. strangulata]|uniref:mitochondrial metalloendopeptidase OMA1-like n=1 Tax=Aegilops tauschii subsp. strangulata TaxID=200361 RepID=UPI003CC8BFDC
MNCMRNSCCGFCRLQSLRRYPNLSPLRPPCCTAADSPWVAIPAAVLLFLVTCDREKVPCTDRVHWVSSPLLRSLIGDTIFETIKEKRGHAFLGPSDLNTVRVRLIASAIFRGAHDLFPRDGDRDNKKAKTTALHDLKWEVIIFNNEKAKAYSLPNGKIVVYTGLLNCLNTDAEIAALIAHEVG